MTSLTPIVNSDYNPMVSNIAANHSFVPVLNTERILYATAVYDINTPSQTGQTGATYIHDTAIHTNVGGWYAIQFIDNTKFTGLTSNWTGNSPTNQTFSKDIVVYGNFTGIQLESGRVLAYAI